MPPGPSQYTTDASADTRSVHSKDLLKKVKEALASAYVSVVLPAYYVGLVTEFVTRRANGCIQLHKGTGEVFRDKLNGATR